MCWMRCGLATVQVAFYPQIHSSRACWRIRSPFVADPPVSNASRMGLGCRRPPHPIDEAPEPDVASRLRRPLDHIELTMAGRAPARSRRILRSLRSFHVHPVPAEQA